MKNSNGDIVCQKKIWEKKKAFNKERFYTDGPYWWLYRWPNKHNGNSQEIFADPREDLLNMLVQANTFCRLGCDISLKLFPNQKWKYGENSLKYPLLCRPKTEKRSIRKLNETARLNLWITTNSWFFKQMMRRTVNRLEAKQNGNSFYTVWHLNCFERSTGRQSFVSFYWKIVFLFKDLREERDGETKSFNMCVKKSFPLRCIVVQVNLF